MLMKQAAKEFGWKLDYGGKDTPMFYPISFNIGGVGFSVILSKDECLSLTYYLKSSTVVQIKETTSL